MDAKEIVKAFREHPEWAQANDFQGSQCAKLLAQLSELRAENASLRAERDKAVEDMTSIADAIANCKEYLSGGRDKVSSLQLGRCPACKAQCHDDKPCKFEWRGTEGKA